MTDIEIARNVKLKNIEEIAESIGIGAENIEQYGKYKAKIQYNNIEAQIQQQHNALEVQTQGQHDDVKKQKGKLILVTAMSPTPLGEGKTTVSISIADGLKLIGKKAILALREPSLGPVFGVKGGATGGGNAQIAPMEDINLHFTGDIHAITSANNLLSAIIDNHIYFGNKLQIEEVTWKRCVDLNDRQLRKISTGLSGEKNIKEREDGFDITVASEIMAILCLSENIQDLKERLGNIIIGYNVQKKPVYVKDLKVQGSLAVLLKDAIKPNLVQTLEHTPCLVHGGPFANIAHGCNSVIATKMALNLGEYVVTEAGFGADLGAEKFCNIKCRKAGITPNIVVCVATIKALKYHGGIAKENIKEENLEGIKQGYSNLKRHIENIRGQFNLPVIVALNKYNTDTEKEIELLANMLKEDGVEMSIVEGWEKGGEGAKEIAKKIVEQVQDAEVPKMNYTYKLEDSIETKIEKVARNIYGASEVKYTEKAKESIHKIEEMGYSNLPICIAKTQFSFSDDAKNLECKENFSINVRDVQIKAGAEFIVVLAGKIMTMPGLPEVPAAEQIDIDKNGIVKGIF